MRAILTTCLATHWTVWFALQAERLIDEFVLTAATPVGLVAAGSVFAAALHAWVGLAVLMPGRRGDDDGEIAAVATAAAVATVAVAVHCAISLPMHGLVEIAALSASYLVSRRADGEATVPAAMRSGSADTRTMARHAAHGAMLARLAGRRVPRGGEEY